MGPEVLRDLSLEIAPRSFQFLTGPSGAGKTSLMRLLFMSLKPTRGLISIFGHDTSRVGRAELPELRRRIGVVFQDFRLLDHLTTYENVALPLRVLGKAESEYRADVVDLLEWVGLGERMHVLPPVLSGGEKQRAAIARALITNPRILIFDEATSALDYESERIIQNNMKAICQGRTVIIIAHRLSAVRDANRIIVVDRGRIVEQGSHAELLGHEAGHYARLHRLQAG